MTVFYVGVLVVTWVALGVVVWIFCRPREEAATMNKRKEPEWPNARLS